MIRLCVNPLALDVLKEHCLLFMKETVILKQDILVLFILVSLRILLRFISSLYILHYYFC